jgi:quercetin dioxygenase-like cupin family protein
MKSFLLGATFASILIFAVRAQQTAPAPTDLHADLAPAKLPQEAILVERDFAPGESSGLHRHCGVELAYVLKGEMEVNVAGQPTRRVHAGDSFRVGHTTGHEVNNTTTGESALLIGYVLDKAVPREFLKPYSMSPLPEPCPNDSLPAQTQRIPQFENDDVKVWKSTILPNAPLAMHRHEHPRVIIALSGGTMKIVQQNGTAGSHIWETGKAYWLPANPPNTMHADVNAGDKPIEVVVVELKKEN